MKIKEGPFCEECGELAIGSVRNMFKQMDWSIGRETAFPDGKFHYYCAKHMKEIKITRLHPIFSTYKIKNNLTNKLKKAVYRLYKFNFPKKTLMITWINKQYQGVNKNEKNSNNISSINFCICQRSNGTE